MNVVVTGGTGFIGRKLVHALVDRGDTVVVLTRDVAQARSSFDARVPFEKLTLESWGPSPAGPWLRRVNEADAIVHLAGAGVMDARWNDERLEVIRTSRTEPTRWMAEAIARASKEGASSEGAERKRRVFVSGSAVGIYGMRKDDDVIDEQAPAGDDVLAKICEEWEAAAAPARKAGVRVAHPRTGIVLGLEGGALQKMLPPFKAFVGGPVGDGTQWVSWIHWRDAVRALVFAIDTPSIEGPFNVTAPKPVTMSAVAHAIGHALHRPAAFKVPAIALKVAIGPAADALLTGQRAVPAVLERAGFTFEFDDIEKALASIVRESPHRCHS